LQAVDNPTYAEIKDVCSATGLNLGVEVSVTSYSYFINRAHCPNQRIQSECNFETLVLKWDKVQSLCLFRLKVLYTFTVKLGDVCLTIQISVLNFSGKHSATL